MKAGGQLRLQLWARLPAGCVVVDSGSTAPHQASEIDDLDLALVKERDQVWVRRCSAHVLGSSFAGPTEDKSWFLVVRSRGNAVSSPDADPLERDSEQAPSGA